jgi:hypothetical protein
MIDLKEFARWVKSQGLTATIPTKEEDLKNLRVLDLTKKKLRELPESIGALEKRPFTIPCQLI